MVVISNLIYDSYEISSNPILYLQKLMQEGDFSGILQLSIEGANFKEDLLTSFFYFALHLLLFFDDNNK